MAILIGVLAGFVGTAANPAAAQVRLGSPGDPPRLALGVGAFDVLPSHHPSSQTAAEFTGEYRFGDQLWIFAPFVGVQATTDGAFYGYAGFGFDINFSSHLVLTPNFAAGYFERGSGSKLGSWLEFRSGAEFDYRFANWSRLGIAVHHTSNAGLTKFNPGEESVMLVYTMPMY